MKYMHRIVCLLSVCLVVSKSLAAEVLDESVAAWALTHSVGFTNSQSVPPKHSYFANTITGTGSSCTGGGLSLSALTVDDTRLFLEYYLVSKVSRQKIRVTYDKGAVCVVKSFGLSLVN